MAKPKGPGIMVAIGAAPPPKYKSPGSEEEEPMEKAAPPASKPPAPSPAMGKKPPMETPEPGESLQQESGENYGEKLLHDMTAPLIEAGLSDDDAKEMMARVFEAAATCLRDQSKPAGDQFGGGGNPGQEPGGGFAA